MAPERHRSGARRLDPQPIWVGGGRAFAAKPRDFSQKVNRKMYRGAMQAMLSELARQDRLAVVNAIELEAPKTKLLVQKLNDLNLGDNVLVLVEAHDEKLELASAQSSVRERAASERARSAQPCAS